jgi:hypothetical protein
LALIVGVLPGCDVVDPPPVDGTMHASIENRTTLNPTFVGSSDPWDAEKRLTATMSPGGNLVITGVENSRVEITLIIYNAAVGSFTSSPGELLPGVEATYGDARTFSYTSSKGGTALVNITSLSATRAVGTFEFVAFPLLVDAEATPAYRVRNGTFSVNIR